MKIEEFQLTRWFSVRENPVRKGWYLFSTEETKYVQSDASATPKFDFPNTVWRYWDGVEWKWYCRAEGGWFYAATFNDSVWRGLSETFPFKPSDNEFVKVGGMKLYLDDDIK